MIECLLGSVPSPFPGYQCKRKPRPQQFKTTFRRFLGSTQQLGILWTIMHLFHTLLFSGPHGIEAHLSMRANVLSFAPMQEKTCKSKFQSIMSRWQQ
jgi:hypothetical protein